MAERGGWATVSCLSERLKAPRMVWVVVPRRRRGLIGGTGMLGMVGENWDFSGEGSLPFERDAPGGRPTVLTEEVEERRVGSEMRFLFTERLREASDLEEWVVGKADCWGVPGPWGGRREVGVPAGDVSKSGGVEWAECAE